MSDSISQKEGMRFETLKKPLLNSGARLGRLIIPKRKTIETPNFIPPTSRGAIPHLTPDVLQRHVPVTGAYYALEDCKQKSFSAQLSVVWWS